MQGVRILRNEAYLLYVAMTKDEAQRSRWIYYEAVKFDVLDSVIFQAVLSSAFPRWR